MEFGHYPQDSDGEILPIKWITVREEAERRLLLSKWGLDCGPFNTEAGSILWSGSSLRAWLNNEFYNLAFSPAEQRLIEPVSLDNSASQIYDTPQDSVTIDRVFLLSPLEFGEELSRRSERFCIATPYAQRMGADMYAAEEECSDGFYAWWWLRWPGYFGNATYVYSNGVVFNDFSVDCSGGCIRPALWIKK
ncbi:MAG: DUF6273 domain-containing protein [Candidatus Bruticola sp.]